jgi:hypothetical protein
MHYLLRISHFLVKKDQNSREISQFYRKKYDQIVPEQIDVADQPEDGNGLFLLRLIGLDMFSQKNTTTFTTLKYFDHTKLTNMFTL